jgi:H2-forming N5,N10-methylenetetrahydromethanopterin dehydrogenase-like enzyme
MAKYVAEQAARLAAESKLDELVRIGNERELEYAKTVEHDNALLTDLSSRLDLVLRTLNDRDMAPRETCAAIKALLVERGASIADRMDKLVGESIERLGSEAKRVYEEELFKKPPE